MGSGAENYGVVYTLAESPVKAGLLWAGTDDGKLWITENDGGTWTDLTASLPAAVKGQWISRVEAGSQDAKVAYLAVDAHRTQNYAPARLPHRRRRPHLAVDRRRPARPTTRSRSCARTRETRTCCTRAPSSRSSSASTAAARWAKLGGLPTVAVDDILVHPRDNDLVVATHGRSLYILDDVARAAGADGGGACEGRCTCSSRARRWASTACPASRTGTASAVFRGENPPEGALLTYWVKAYTGEPVKIAVKSAGRRAGRQPHGHRRARPAARDLGPEADQGPADRIRRRGLRCFLPAGEYTVTLTHGDAKDEQKLKRRGRPRDRDALTARS